MTDELHLPDQAPGAPHPREATDLFGQDQAERAFLDAFNAGRLHHGWLLTGPRGAGKATLAWRIARFLLATPEQADDGLFGAPSPPDTLAIAADHPVSARLLAGSESGVHVVRRGGMGNTESDRSRNFLEGRFSHEIRVDEIRDLAQFIHMSAPDGGRRVVIVDAADELNTSAANALLKMLEEPPARTTFLLVSHQPSRLLPTIRSRCRSLRLSELQPDTLRAALAQAGADLPSDGEALAVLSRGSPGDALRLITLDGLKIYAELIALLSTLPRLDRPRAVALAEAAAQRGAADRFDLLLDLTDLLLARLARTGAMGQPPLPAAAPGESDLLQRLSATRARGRAWASLAAEIGARTRHGRAVNLDPAALVLDTVFKIQDIATKS